mgnify:CR=1 FL=1
MSVDVTDTAGVKAFVDEVAAAWGGVDCLINNAGQGRVSRFSDTGDAEWREELELKFFSVIRPLRAFMAMLEKSPCAAVVCVNSLLAAQPEPHMVATSAARAGVLNLSHSLGIELAPKKIRVILMQGIKRQIRLMQSHQAAQSSWSFGGRPNRGQGIDIPGSRP